MATALARIAPPYGGDRRSDLRGGPNADVAIVAPGASGRGT
jgi:hypothetical protein